MPAVFPSYYWVFHSVWHVLLAAGEPYTDVHTMFVCARDDLSDIGVTCCSLLSRLLSSL